jgi:DNA-binding transcriptional ArsR family regulator
MSEPRTFRLTDAKQMLALAHPLRLQLLGLLRVEGPSTATSLGERLAVSVPLASYHLRQLAAHGFIEEAPELSGDRRERWWRAAHERTSWATADWLDTPERMTAAGLLGREVARRYRAASDQWLDEAPAWSREWVDASDMSDWVLELTADELRSLREELAAVVERYEDRPRRTGSEHVQVILQLLPRPRRP